MSLLHGFGDGKIKVVATEVGWEDGKGKLLCSVVNLLSQRVLQGIATKEEIIRWAGEKQEQIDLKREAVSKAQQKNKERIAILVAKFDTDNAELKKQSLTNPTAKVQYLTKSVEIAKLEEEYTKADAVSNRELENLKIKEDRIKARLAAAEVLVGEEQDVQKKVESLKSADTTEQSLKNIQDAEAEKAAKKAAKDAARAAKKAASKVVV